MSDHVDRLPLRRVRSAPPSLGALTYRQPEAQAPTARNNVDEPRGLLPRGFWLALHFGWQLIVMFCTFLARHILPGLFVQQEAQENNSELSSPLSVSSLPELELIPQPDITSEDEITPATLSPQHVPSSPSIPSPQPIRSIPSPAYSDEIRPATPTPPRVPSPPSIPSPQPILSTRHVRKVNSTPICGFMIVCAGVVIGYASNVLGGVISMKLFINDLSHDIYYKASKDKETNYCVYTNAWLLLFAASIGLSSSISLLAAFAAYIKWGKRKVLIWIGFATTVVGLIFILRNPNAVVISIGMALIGTTRRHAPGCKDGVIGERINRHNGSSIQPRDFLWGALAFIVNYLSVGNHRNSWRIPFYVLIGLSCPLFVFCCFIREIPRPKIQIKLSIRTILEPRCHAMVIITVVRGVLKEIQGLGTFLFFAPLLLESVSSSYLASKAFLAPLILASVHTGSQVVTHCFALFSDRRRELLIVASTTTLFSLSLLWVLFHFNVSIKFHPSTSVAIFAIVMVFFYTVANACIYGPHGWITEEFPSEAKLLGSVLDSTLSSWMALGMQMSLLFLICGLKDNTYSFFAGISFIALLFICFFVPKTPGISILEVVEKVRRLPLPFTCTPPCTPPGLGFSDSFLF